MNKHDEHRRNRTIKALLKVKECLDMERLHLSVQDPAPMAELYKVHDALDHVVNALDRLTAAELGEVLPITKPDAYTMEPITLSDIPNDHLREAAINLHTSVNTYWQGDCDKATVIKAQSKLCEALNTSVTVPKECPDCGYALKKWIHASYACTNTSCGWSGVPVTEPSVDRAREHDWFSTPDDADLRCRACGVKYWDTSRGCEGGNEG